MSIWIPTLHSTLTALLEATNDWCVNVDDEMLNVVVFVDLKKAWIQSIMVSSYEN